MKKMTVATARRRTGSKSDYSLAKLLKVSRQRVSQWKQRGWIAEHSAIWIRDKYPLNTWHARWAKEKSE